MLNLGGFLQALLRRRPSKITGLVVGEVWHVEVGLDGFDDAILDHLISIVPPRRWRGEVHVGSFRAW